MCGSISQIFSLKHYYRIEFQFPSSSSLHQRIPSSLVLGVKYEMSVHGIQCSCNTSKNVNNKS